MAEARRGEALARNSSISEAEWVRGKPLGVPSDPVKKQNLSKKYPNQLW
jgi:hypothetical protein